MEYMKNQVQTYRSGKPVMDQFYIDDDYNVPDVKSDVKQVILGEGRVIVEDMKRVENYIRVTGKMNFRILYVSEEGESRLASVEGRIPFEETVYMEQEPVGTLVVKQANTELTVTMIHSRKLNIKALVDMEIASEGMETADLTTNIMGEESFFKKSSQHEFLKMMTSKKDTYRIKEEVVISGTKENVGTLLWTDVSSRKLDTRLGTDELLLQGELVLFCFYESMEGKVDWVEQVIPYDGRIECYGAQDNMYHQIYPDLSDINIDVRMDEDGEMRLLGVEATLEIRLVVYAEQREEVIEDMYSLNQECTPKVKEERFEKLLMQNHSKCKVIEQLSLPEIKDSMLQVCHSGGRIQLDNTEIVDSGIQIDGVLHISFLYVKADDDIPFDTWQGMVPFSYLLESNETSPDMTYDLTYTVEQLSISLLGSDEIEVKAVLAFNSFLKKPIKIANIEEVVFTPINMEELENRPGIVGYIVKDNDRLWDLAKRYSTTVEGIMEVNNLESEQIKQGDKILIFKENMSIL